MSTYSKKWNKRDYDYEEDDYDRLKSMDKKKTFTNKATKKKFEFDYEEDPYEPRG